MTAAEDRRDELEALLLRFATLVFPADTARQGAFADEVLKAADAYADAKRRPPRKPGTPSAKSPAVHYALTYSGGIVRPACRPHRHSGPVGDRKLTATVKSVTCGHCRKTPAWQQAASAGGP